MRLSKETITSWWLITFFATLALHIALFFKPLVCPPQGINFFFSNIWMLSANVYAWIFVSCLCVTFGDEIEPFFAGIIFVFVFHCFSFFFFVPFSLQNIYTPSFYAMWNFSLFWNCFYYIVNIKIIHWTLIHLSLIHYISKDQNVYWLAPRASPYARNKKPCDSLGLWWNSDLDSRDYSLFSNLEKCILEQNAYVCFTTLELLIYNLCLSNIWEIYVDLYVRYTSTYTIITVVTQLIYSSIIF